ncbi:hypothetical protein NM688_g1624 [Phlebia brevispora]|uniref:Uncharacterized protein n=1 Tax=Phlebia brevispora TaxID=194682 RepID=A0ACC1TAW8_9APHY|nr:hypothetical protein NM688_g1624 [Phlebia brevispora]
MPRQSKPKPTKSRQEWARDYAKLDRERAAQKLTAPRGFWILRSYAAKYFSDAIGHRDLDSILPISRRKNQHGGLNDIMKYNLCDVVALVLRLQPTYGPTERAPPRGQEIMLSKARDEYKLESCQLRRLKPRRTAPNPHQKGEMTFYNREDVVALNAQIEAAAKAPRGVPIARNNTIDAPYDFDVEDYFLGLSVEDAATKFTELTDLPLEAKYINKET